ncbi:MAG: hypothetical protein INH43_18885 [Acidobacteriaceae bacterium]|nr:hypothetical protein [Acidobacteriaceae bacterium]
MTELIVIFSSIFVAGVLFYPSTSRNMKELILSVISIAVGCGVMAYAAAETHSILQGLAGAFLAAAGCVLAGKANE